MKKSMKRSRRLLSLLLALTMALSMSFSMPLTAHASTGPVTIDLNTLGESGQNNAGAPSQSQWSYQWYGSTTPIGVLTLSSASGNYTLRGKNERLQVVVGAAAQNADITLADAEIAAYYIIAGNGDGAFNVRANCTIRAVGNNKITSVRNGITVLDGVNCTINKHGQHMAGALTAESRATSTESYFGIMTGSGGSLVITGNTKVTASGGVYVINNRVEVTQGASLYTTAGPSGSSGSINCGSGGNREIMCNGYISADGGLGLSGAGQLLISGSGTLSSNNTISSGGDLRIDACDVTARGVRAVEVTGAVIMGDAAKLTMQNGGSVSTHTFRRSVSTSSLRWILSGAAATADLPTAETITVNLPHNSTGTVSRGVNVPVAITSQNSYTCAAGTGNGGSFSLTANGTPQITWSLTGAPAGVSVTGSTLNVASTAAPGTYNFTITASNGVAPNATQSFTLRVTGSAPTVSGPEDIYIQSGYTQTQSARFTVTGSPAPAVTPRVGGGTNSNIKWNNETQSVDITPGLGQGILTVNVTASNGISPDAARQFTVVIGQPAAVSGGGSPYVSMLAGYAAFSTETFTITGYPTPTVEKVDGDDAFTWNSATSRIDVAAGLTAGTHKATFKAYNGFRTEFFNLFFTVATHPRITGPTAMSLSSGYAAVSTDAFTVTGIPSPTVTKTAGHANITWNSAAKKLDIAPGLAAGTYPVTLRADNQSGNPASHTFTLTVTQASAMAVIEVNKLGGSDANNKDNPGESQWSYTNSTKMLLLSQPNGNYTLKGNNNDLNVATYSGGANNPNITLENVDITTVTSGNVFQFGGVSVVTLVGNNFLRVGGVTTYSGSYPVFTSGTGGSLNISTPNDMAVYCYGNGFSITGNAAVTAESTKANGYGIFLNSGGTIDVGPAASLTAKGGKNGLYNANPSRDVHLNIDGAASFTSTAPGDQHDGIRLERALVISGSGAVLAKGNSGPNGNCGIYHGGGVTVKGCHLTAVGAGREPIMARSGQEEIVMDSGAKLTLTNGYDNWPMTYYFKAENPFDGLVWQAEGGIPVSGADLLSDRAGITIPSNGTATISRVPIASPVITSANNYTCVSGTGGSFDFTGSGSPPITSWHISGSAPTGVTVSGNKLNVPGTIAAGVYNFTVTAQSQVQPNATQNFTLTVQGPPNIEGPAQMTLPAGYSAANTNAFMITGSPLPTVNKTSGNAALTWNNAERRIDIASGLPGGTYPVVITASNGILPAASHTFTLTVNSAPGVTGPNTMTLASGYSAASSNAFTITGFPAPTVKIESGPSNITWNTNRLSIAPGLAPGAYPVELSAKNGVSPDLYFTFTLTVTGNAPHITGPAAMSLTKGYQTVSSDLFAVTGSPLPELMIAAGDPAIALDGNKTRLVISAGLEPGVYPVELWAINGVSPMAVHIFTLTVSGTAKPGDINGDGKVDATDLSLLISDFGIKYDMSHLAELLQHFGQ